MYYANEFIYYYLKNGTKNYINYTGIRLYTSQKEALDNSEREWLEISSDKDILTEIKTKEMYIYKEEKTKKNWNKFICNNSECIFYDQDVDICNLCICNDKKYKKNNGK